MRFVLIDPKEKQISYIEAPDVRSAAIDHADLGGVDHGSLGARIFIVVDEFGLLKPPAEQAFFSLGGQLYANKAIVYATDEAGETVDFPLDKLPRLREVAAFWESVADIEAAIADGLLQRPQTSINGEVVWEWNK